MEGTLFKKKYLKLFFLLLLVSVFLISLQVSGLSNYSAMAAINEQETTIVMQAQPPALFRVGSEVGIFQHDTATRIESPDMVLARLAIEEAKAAPGETGVTSTGANFLEISLLALLGLAALALILLWSRLFPLKESSPELFRDRCNPASANC